MLSAAVAVDATLLLGGRGLPQFAHCRRLMTGADAVVSSSAVLTLTYTKHKND